jgi:hypothetical protein
VCVWRELWINGGEWVTRGWGEAVVLGYAWSKQAAVNKKEEELFF